MHTIDLDQLQDEGSAKTQLKDWLKAGETVELREQEAVLGRIVPEMRPVAVEVKRAVEWPDFEARAKAIFGDRVLNAVDDLIADRENSRW